MKTLHLNDIGDLGIYDMSPNNVTNANDHVTLRLKRASTTVSPRECRRRGNVNPNVEDYLE